MDGRANLAAGGSAGVFHFGGRTFVVSRLTGPESLAVSAEFRRQCLSTSENPLLTVNDEIAAAERAGKPLSPTVQKLMVQEAMSARSREERKAEPTDGDVAARIHTLDGSRFFVWFRLSRVDSSVTRAWVDEHMPDMAARNEAMAALLVADGYADLDPKKATPTGSTSP